MNITTQAELIRRIDEFLARHDIKDSRLSRDATGEPGLVAAIRNGRSPTLAIVEKLMTLMADTDARAALHEKLTADLPPVDESENQLPFGAAPVNPTGASSPTSSPTSARPQPSAASDSCPSCSVEDEAR